MKKVWIAIMFTLTVIACKTQEDLKKDNKRDYSAEWSTIDEHIKKGFPEKAIKELDSLIEKARAEDDQIVATQAILRRINLKNLDQQDFMKEQMAYLKEQHKITTDPESEAFINYALALVYQNYWESNQNLIPRESEGDDEWDGRRYLAVIDSLIKKVLREDFKKLPVKNVDSFFDSQAYEPTMMLWDYFMLEQIRLQKSLVYKKLLGEEESRNLVEASYDDLVTKLNAQAQVRLAIETEIARLNYKKEDVTSVSLNGRMKYKFIVDYHIALSLLQEAQSAADNKALQSVKYSESAKLFAAVKSAGDSIYSHNAQVQLDFIEKSELSFQIERVLIPNKRSLVYVESRNLSKIFLRIYKLTKDDYLQQNRRNEDGYKNKPIVHEESVDLPLSAYKFVSSSTEIAVPKLPAGYYAIVINNQVNFYDQDKSPLFESDFLVSNLAINNYYDEGTSRMVLECVNRTTGELYDGAQFTVFDSQYDRKLGRQKMIALYEGRGNPTFSYAADVSKSLYPYVEMDGQFFSNSEGLYHNNSKGTARKTSNVFTDRAIYRPGQDIHFKGIVHEHDREGVPRLAQGVKLKVRVTDNMGNEVEVFNFTSDEYGAYTGVVKIPASTQNGSINLNISGDQSRLNAYKTVRVEEYKRPKYEVNFEESAQELKLGEKVSVKAVAMGYTGVPVADAKVNYKVYRSGWWPYFYRGYRSYFPSYDSGRTLLRAGDVMTDGAGAVEIDFIAERSISSPELKNYSYTVELEVVDNTGETKSATKSLNISEQSVFIKFSKTKTEGEYIISTVNSEDQALAARVALEVYRKSVDKYKLERYWRFPDTTVVNIADFSDFSFVNADKAYPESIYRATFEVEDTIRVNLKDIVGAGSFKIKLESGDDAKVEQEIEILDFDNSIYGTNKLFYIEGLSATYQPGDELNLRIGSSVKDVNIQIQMFKNNELISEEWRTVDGFTRISEQITEDDYGGYSVLIKCYYKNRIYHEELQVVVPWLHKKLFIKPKSIRYVTEPGAPEKWTFVVTNKDGKPVQASFLSSMYDISLDEFQPHDWSMSLYRNYFGFYFRRDNSFSGQSLHTRNYGWNNGSLFLKPFEIAPTFRFAPVRFHYFERRMKRSAAPMLDAVTVTGASARVQEEPEAELNEMLAVDIEQDIAAPAPPANVRTNLAELVFFYPDLKTNENGEVSIEFTNNEALTKWKLQNFAFTKDLKYGFSSEEIVTKKDLMIQANQPRFLRSGDKIFLSAKLLNLTNQPQKVEASLSVYDLVTQKRIDQKSSAIKADIGADGQQEVFWEVEVPDQVQRVRLTYSVVGGNHDDAEQYDLSVFPSEIYLMDSKTVLLDAKGKATIDLDALKGNTRRATALTIESTGSPAWYAVRSLPYLMENEEENSEAVFNRYFANALALKILDENPLVETYYKEWKVKGELKSQLSVNETLKNVDLRETPWLLDALSEEENMERIAGFFDRSRVESELLSAATKLERMQMPIGGFPWYKGGRANYYMSQYILEGVLRLKELGIEGFSSSMQSRL